MKLECSAKVVGLEAFDLDAQCRRGHGQHVMLFHSLVATVIAPAPTISSAMHGGQITCIAIVHWREWWFGSNMHAWQ